MQTGEIYLFDNSAAGYMASVILHDKIISFDKYEVFSDGKRITEEKWDLDANRIKTKIFARSRRNAFDKWSTLIGYEPYSDERLAVIRPDLPMRIGRIYDISWGDQVFNSEETIAKYLETYASVAVRTKMLDVKEVYLKRQSKTAGSSVPFLVTADNGKNIPLEELLFKANQIQSSLKTEKSAGIGIYRSGIIKGIPSYYIWSFYDLAGTMMEYENMGVDITEA